MSLENLTIITHEITVDIRKSNTVVLRIPQYNENAHLIVATVTDNGKPFTIPNEGYEAYLKVATSNKHYYNKTMTIDAENNTVSIILPETIAVISGKHAAQIDFINLEESAKISSLPFVIYVMDSVYTNDVEISGDQFDELMAMLTEARDKIDEFEDDSARALEVFEENANQAISDFEDEAQDTINDVESRFETVLEYYPSLYVRRNKIIHLYDAYANAHLQELKLYDSNRDAISGANIAITNKNLMRIDLLPSSETIDSITFTKNDNGGIEISGTRIEEDVAISCTIDKNAFVEGHVYSMNSNKTTGHSGLRLTLTYTDQTTQEYLSATDPVSFVVSKKVESALAEVFCSIDDYPIEKYTVTQYEKFSTNGSTYQVDIIDIPESLRDEEYITVSFSNAGNSDKDQYIDSYTIDGSTLNITLKDTRITEATSQIDETTGDITMEPGLVHGFWSNIYVVAIVPPDTIVLQTIYPQIELSKSPSSFANNYYSEQYVDTSLTENVLPILPACISNIWANDDTVEEIELFYTQDVGSAMDDLHSEIGDSLAPQEIYEAINATIVDDTLDHVLYEETF